MGTGDRLAYMGMSGLGAWWAVQYVDTGMLVFLWLAIFCGALALGILVRP